MFWTLDEKEEQGLDSVYSELRSYLRQLSNSETTDAYDSLDRVLKYHVYSGNRSRGRLLIKAYRALVTSPADSDLKVVRVLSWCVEMLNAGYQVGYDFMENRLVNEFGAESWYKVDGIGVSCLNDCVILRSATYKLLKNYTKDKPYYSDILELFFQTSRSIVVGQRMEDSFRRGDLGSLTMERYNIQTDYNTGNCSLCLPVCCAMIVAGITDEESQNMAKKTLLQMGRLVQIEKDYYSCFGDSRPNGDTTADIRDKKCTWMIARALQLASNEDGLQLQTYWTRTNDQDVEQVMEMYKSLELPAEYKVLREKEKQQIMMTIHAGKSVLVNSMLVAIFDYIFHDTGSDGKVENKTGGFHDLQNKI